MIVYRGNNEFLNVEVDNSTQLKQELGGEDVVYANFTLDFFYKFQMGDYIDWRGKKYTIYDEPSVDKSRTNEIKYEIVFKSDQYRFTNAKYFLDSDVEFNLRGDLQKFASLLVNNLNRLAGSEYYLLGNVPMTETLDLTFSNANCLLALQTIASEFGKEFSISNDGRTIDFVDKLGVDTGLTYRFKEGLRNIKRVRYSDRDMVTRIYAFGGEKNITNDYGSKKLRIDAIENNTNLFGVIEGVVTFDEVYPKRLGTVTSLGGDLNTFLDSGIDFDVNDQLMPGVTAKVTFNTGQLAGYEFEIAGFNNATKQFVLISYEETNGSILPSNTFPVQVGDQYVIHDIIMPQSYIDNAESELQQKANQYLLENSVPNAIYSLLPHFPYLRENLIQLNVGDIITISDDDFGITFQTRILNLTQSLANPYLYSITVGDKVVVNYITRVLSNQRDFNNNLIIERKDRTVQYNQIRRNLRNIDELKESIFDPDGYFDAEKIKPLSIETTMLSVGGKSRQFIIRELLIEPNYQADPNKTNFGNGVLVHFLIEDTIKEWNLTGAVKTHADSAQYYYIYARCVRNGTTGDFVVTSNQYQVDAGSTYYYFLIGIVHSVQDGVRGISLTYGQTTINGKFITTGRIQSIDGVNFFDLDTGQFFIGDETNSIDWNVTNANRVTIKGGILQTPQGDEIVIPNYKGSYDNSATYYTGDVVNYSDTLYISISQNGTTGELPTNDIYWEVYTPAGAQGPPGQDGSDGIDGLGTIPLDIGLAKIGGVGDFIFTLDSDSNGNVNTGEIRVQATRFTHPNGNEINFSLGSGTQLITPYGEGESGRFYIMYSATTAGTRFPTSPYMTDNNFITVRIVNGVWKAFDNNNTDYDITFVATDCFLAVVEAKNTTGGLTGLAIFVSGATGLDGAPGSDGQDGQDGGPGPAIVFRGDFSTWTSTQFYNNSNRRDVIKRGSDYLIYKGTNGATQSSYISANWETFGAIFDMVATNLLLAEGANIGDWIIKNGRITSQDENSQLYGATGKIHLLGTQYASYDSRTRLEGEGISITGGGLPTFQQSTSYDSDGNPSSPTTFGVHATVSGKNPSQGTSSVPRAGVHGVSLHDDENSFGGLFTSLKSFGRAEFGGTMIFKTRRGGSRTLDNTDFIYIATSGSTITMPNSTNRFLGQGFVVKRATSSAVTLNGNGESFYHNENEGSTFSVPEHGESWFVVWDGIYWQSFLWGNS